MAAATLPFLPQLPDTPPPPRVLWEERVETSEQDERRWVAEANAGKASGFDAIYGTHKAYVLGLAHRFTRSDADALDVLQETFLWFFGLFPGFELRSSLRAFLYPVVKHEAMNLHRRRKRVVSLEDLREGTKPEEPSAAPDETKGDLERRLRVLPEGQREVVALRFESGLRLNEIAEALSLPLGTVKSRLHNALKVLRDNEPNPSLER